jgi:hypothetical protein
MAQFLVLYEIYFISLWYQNAYWINTWNTSDWTETNLKTMKNNWNICERYIECIWKPRNFVSFGVMLAVYLWTYFRTDVIFEMIKNLYKLTCLKNVGNMTLQNLSLFMQKTVYAGSSKI